VFVSRKKKFYNIGPLMYCLVETKKKARISVTEDSKATMRAVNRIVYSGCLILMPWYMP